MRPARCGLRVRAPGLAPASRPLPLAAGRRDGPVVRQIGGFVGAIAGHAGIFAGAAQDALAALAAAADRHVPRPALRQPIPGIAIGIEYFDRTGCALVTVESHIRYLAEVQRGETLAFDSQVLAFDARRIHMAHLFRVGERACGSVECMWLHVDSRLSRSVPMPDEVQAALAAVAAAEMPAWAGRSVALKR